MPNLGIIYDVTKAVKENERNTNKKVIYQPTCLRSFVIFDGFYFCLWPRTLSFGRNGRKSLASNPQAKTKMATAHSHYCREHQTEFTNMKKKTTLSQCISV